MWPDQGDGGASREKISRKVAGFAAERRRGIQSSFEDEGSGGPRGLGCRAQLWEGCLPMRGDVGYVAGHPVWSQEPD